MARTPAPTNTPRSVLTNLLATLLVITLLVLSVWLVLRARRSPSAPRRWAGIAVGSIMAVILFVVGAASARGMFMLYGPRGRALRDITVEGTPERIARGQHIANTTCVGCHSLNYELPLSGGRNLSDEAGLPLGDLYTINLTPAGPLAGWTDAEIFRAIRDAADNRNRRLPVMSAQRVRYLSDDDIYSVIAYIRSQPPVENETPPVRPSFLTVVMAGANMLPLLPGMAPDTIVAPPPGPTLEYGEYMVRWMGCDECHGPNYTGGGGGVLPVGPSLRSVKNWTAEQFMATMRTGTTPFGKKLDSLNMPWKIYGRATDAELTAIHTYLASLE
jgi:mono/diheme cytochrome c family protein